MTNDECNVDWMIEKENYFYIDASNAEKYNLQGIVWYDTNSKLHFVLLEVVKNMQVCLLFYVHESPLAVAYRGGVQTPPPPKFRSFDKAEPNSQFRGKYIWNNLIRIRVSLICKLSGTPE
jgi:hypothetical protein